MKKIFQILLLILISTSTAIAQNCANGHVEATVEFYSGINSMDKHWFIVEDLSGDTVLSYSPKNIESSIPDETDSLQYICLEIGKSYTYYAYSVSGYGWNQGFLSIFVNNNPVAFSHGQEPNNFLPDTISSNSYTARPYDLENKETFTVKPVYENDLKITSLELPRVSCNLSDKQQIKIRIANLGSTTQLSATVGLKINNSVYAIEDIFDYFSPLNILENIDSINIVEYTFKAKPNMSSKGVYNLKVFVTDDDNRSNDTLRAVIENTNSTDSIQHQSTKEFIGYYNSNIESSISFCGLNNKLSDDYNIQFLKLDSIVHSYMTDLILYLISPSHDTLLLSYRAGLNMDDIVIFGGRGFFNTTFTDTSSINIGYTMSTLYKDDFYHPEQLEGFSLFNGTNPNGQWTLGIQDLIGINGGVFYGWSMGIGSKNLSGINNTNIKTANTLIYPNPTNDILNIHVSDYFNDAKYEIISAQGNIVMQGEISSTHSTINLYTLPKGIYFVKIKSEKGFEINKFSKI